MEILVEGGADVPIVREILQRHFNLVENRHFRIHPHQTIFPALNRIDNIECELRIEIFIPGGLANVGSMALTLARGNQKKGYSISRHVNF